MRFKVLIKTSRINFLPASLIPFFTGAALAIKNGFHIKPSILFLGAFGVAFAHLTGNVVNELYDNKSGADLLDDRRSPFFGGSKTIKDGMANAREVMLLALTFLAASFICGLSILFITKDPLILVFMAVGGVLTVGYTAPPLKLSYRKLGEIDIFLLFGTFLVMGSYYLFTGVFSPDPFSVSLPVSFLIASVILCNEVPDLRSDMNAGKLNLISIAGQKKGYIFYIAAVALSFISIFVNIATGGISPFAAILGIFYLLGLKAALIMKESYSDFSELVKASRLTIILHFLVGTGIIVSILLK